MKKIVVPEGMSRAAESAIEADERPGFRYLDWSGNEESLLPVVLTVALQWLSENPIVPTHQQMRDWCDERNVGYDDPFFPNVFQAISDWQSRMFLAAEIPDAVKDLLAPALFVKLENHPGQSFKWSADQHNNAVIAAYRRGKAAR